MDENIRNRFDHSWHEWFDDRYSDDADDVKVHMDESTDAYVYRPASCGAGTVMVLLLENIIL
jgi:hypothetical protein